MHATGNGRLFMGAAAAVLSAALAGAPSARADDPGLLAVSLGAFNAFDDRTAAEARLEYRSGRKVWIFAPLAGLTATGDGMVHGYLGLTADLRLGRRFVVTNGMAAGVWSRGDGKDLGHLLEFRSQLEFAYLLDDRSRIGVSVSHISNASLHGDNPGAESLMLTYAVPFSARPG